MGNPRILPALFTAALVGCSGGPTDDDDEPIQCSMSERTGVYLLEWTELDGTCGPIPDELVRIDPASPLPDGCTLDAPDTVSPDECTLERSATCTDTTGLYLRSVSTTTQENDDASLVTGLVTVDVRNPDGSAACLSTYRLRYVRQ
jgi:hypothetical protein